MISGLVMCSYCGENPAISDGFCSQLCRRSSEREREREEFRVKTWNEAIDKCVSLTTVLCERVSFPSDGIEDLRDEMMELKLPRVG